MVEEAPPLRRRRPIWRAFAWAAALILGLSAVVMIGVDSDPGHRLIVDRLAALRTPTGLRIRIGRIDGSIWHRMVLRDVRLDDPKGRFLVAPEIRLDWHPLAWSRNLLSIDRLAADQVTLERWPRLHGRPNQPILPGFDIRIARLHIGRLRLGAGVAGHSAEMRIDARAEVRRRRALIALDAASGAGDRAVIDLDAEPDGNRFRLGAHVNGPAGGVIGGLFGTRRPIAVSIGGKGGWQAWRGRALATFSGRPVVDLALSVDHGRYGLAGRLAPAPFVSGKLQRLSTPAVRVSGHGTLADRRLAGGLSLASPAITVAARGTLDLAHSRFSGVKIDARLLRPPALFPNMTGRDVRLAMAIDGPFAGPGFRYVLASPHVAFDQTGFDDVHAAGEGHFGHLPVAVPVRLQAARVTGVGEVAGGILARLSVIGTLHVDRHALVGTGLALTSDKLGGRLGLRVDLVTGRYDVALSGGLQRFLIPGLGIIDVDSELDALPGPGGRGTVVIGRGTAVMRRFDNLFLASLAGGLPRLETRLERSPDGILHFSNLVLTGPSIRISGAGFRRHDATLHFEGSGTQSTYGPFRLVLDGMIDHPKIDLQFDHPVDALGLQAVHLSLDPVPEGFSYRAEGMSALGRFSSTGLVRTGPGQPTTIEVAALDVSGTRARGTVRAVPGGFLGQLDVAGGGIAGAIRFMPQGGVQRIDPQLTLSDATLAAPVPVTLRRGRVNGTILLDPAGAAIEGQASAIGLHRGALSLPRMSATVRVKGGTGSVTLALAGARGRVFSIDARADLAPGRVSVAAQGKVDQQPIRLAAPAQFTADGAGGWQLAPARIDYGGGSATLAGRLAPDAVRIDGALEAMPLTVLDMLAPSLGLSGSASGKLSYAHVRGGVPVGQLDLTVRGLSRSGLVLASQPIDLGLAARLTATGLAARAVAAARGRVIGRAQAKIGPLGPGADIGARLGAAPLFAQLRYVGPGDTLWRLTGVETIDLSGPLSVAADAGGTLDNPVIRGVLRTEAGRIESAVTGTVVEGIKASGRFNGSRLLLDTISGVTPGGGTVSGHGAFDFAAPRGVGIDLAIDANEAQLLNRDDIGATVTGALTIRSSGSGGTIAGDVTLNRSRYRLGAAAAAQVARLPVSEINQPDEEVIDETPSRPWMLDLTAHARNRLMITGLGLDSEWRAKLTLKGAVNDPAIGGQADLIQGGYQFAGRRFDLARGTIRFQGTAPLDPILDISAQANVESVNASIHVSGTGLKPEISFESVPALPEDELLSRLLFGTSIANLSAPEALQLATAVASLRAGGSGLNLDPINAVRKVVRLDRLRILPADVTTGQKTSIAAGKYIGHRTYVEVVTDGAGYSATSAEFRITRWLSLLSSISTIGRQSASVRVSKDY